MSNLATLFIGLYFLIAPSLVLPSAGDYFISNNVIEFKNSSYETYGQDTQKVVLRAKKGYLNLNNQDLKLIGKIKGKIIAVDKILKKLIKLLINSSLFFIKIKVF